MEEGRAGLGVATVERQGSVMEESNSHVRGEFDSSVVDSSRYRDESYGKATAAPL